MLFYPRFIDIKMRLTKQEKVWKFATKWLTTCTNSAPSTWPEKRSTMPTKIKITIKTIHRTKIMTITAADLTAKGTQVKVVETDHSVVSSLNRRHIQDSKASQWTIRIIILYWSPMRKVNKERGMDWWITRVLATSVKCHHIAWVASVQLMNWRNPWAM